MTADHPFRPNAEQPFLCNGKDLVLCLLPESEHPQEDPGTPAWWTAPAPPDWVLEHTGGVGGWCNVGERRWRGALPMTTVFNQDVLLLADAGDRGFVRFALDVDDLDPVAAVDIINQAFDDMQAELDHQLLPGCAKPGCDDKAPQTFTAAEPGPLAGQQRAPGEQIHFCPRHGHDVWCAASGGPIADWLKPDAVRLDPVDAMWAAAGAGDHAAYTEAVDRLRRLTTFIREPS